MSVKIVQRYKKISVIDITNESEDELLEFGDTASSEEEKVNLVEFNGKPSKTILAKLTAKFN